MPTTTLNRPDTPAPQHRTPRPRPSGATARAASRNRARVAVGALVLVASALAAGLLYANAGDRRPVLAVARPVGAGQVLEASDLREVLASPVPGLRTVPASARGSLVGRTATVRLESGSLLHPAQVARGSVVDPTLAEVGGLLQAGQFPIGLRAGDRVLAIVLAPAGAPPDPTQAPVRAVVVAIGTPAGTGLPVSLGVAPGDAALVATAGAGGRLALVVASR